MNGRQSSFYITRLQILGMNPRLTLGVLVVVSVGMLSNQAEAQDFNKTFGNISKSPDDPSNPENIIIKYCIQNANKVAQGYDVIQDLVKSGLVSNSSFGGKTCPQVQAEHERDKIRQDFEKIDPIRNSLDNGTADR
jgi:hypothetical protein